MTDQSEALRRIADLCDRAERDGAQTPATDHRGQPHPAHIAVEDVRAAIGGAK